MDLGKRGCHLEPLAEVERALLVVKVLESPQPQLGSLLVLRGAEHFCKCRNLVNYVNGEKKLFAQ